MLRHLARSGSPVEAALLVAPADPERFGLADEMSRHALRIPSLMLASETDPWMRYDRACSWARAWGSHLLCLGDAGHINVESGHGPLPLALELVEKLSASLHKQPAAEPAEVPAAVAGPDRGDGSPVLGRGGGHGIGHRRAQRGRDGEPGGRRGDGARRACRLARARGVGVRED